MSYRISIDTGGTFTDVIVADPDGRLTINKALTDHARVFRGIREALTLTAQGYGIGLEDLLAQTSLFIYATTRATNAIIEGKTARTAFLTTRGFADTLLLREGGKPSAFDFTTPYPEPYVPRRYTYEIDERIDAEGRVVVPLDDAQVVETLRRAARRDPEALAVSLLWSIANPAHEKRIGELIRQELPGVPFTLAHEINPVMREYRRASAAAIDASLKPLMQDHLLGLQQDLEKASFRGQLVAATSFGGVMNIEDLVQSPLYSTRSGPSMAPVAGRAYGAAEVGAADVIICDTGGTSFDVSMVRDSEVVFTDETWLGGRYLGHLTGLASVDARSIGSGGGSIAWIDSGGLLRVGPESAGSEPGPAAYGNGGTRPTVTDAATVLGYLNPDNFLGGRFILDRDAAVRALSTIAEPLGITPQSAAAAVMRIASEHMVQAVQEITVNEGVDPRNCLIVAGGGAAGLNIAHIVRELGSSRVLIPKLAGGLSACGAQFSDVVHEYPASQFADSSDFDEDGVNGLLQSLSAKMDADIERLRRTGVDAFSRAYFARARYRHQAWELELPLRSERFDGASDVAAMVEDFHAVHERVFAVRDPHSAVELVSFKARLTGIVSKPPLIAADSNRSPAPASGHREMFFEGVGVIEGASYSGPTLWPGAVVEGPAVIEEPTTTVVVFPGMTAQVTALGNYMIETGA